MNIKVAAFTVSEKSSNTCFGSWPINGLETGQIFLKSALLNVFIGLLWYENQGSCIAVQIELCIGNAHYSAKFILVLANYINKILLCSIIIIMVFPLMK